MKMHKDKAGHYKLRDQVQVINKEFWPTPTESMVTIQDMEQARYAGNDPNRPKYKDVKIWPTPAARDYKNQHGPNSAAFKKRKENPRGVNLVEELQRRGDIGQLNPQFVEWLMGYPINWTDIRADYQISLLKEKPE